MSMIPSGERRLLVELEGDSGKELPVSGDSVRGARLRMIVGSADESVVGGAMPGLYLAESPRLNTAMHPWDEAHRAVDDRVFLETAAPVAYAEPDLLQAFPYRPDQELVLEARREACVVDPPVPEWPSRPALFAWHLGDDYSQLLSARNQVDDPGDGARILIDILDTGYDPDHVTLPRYLRKGLARNFVDRNHPDDATDPARHFPGSNPGHGTATLAILAGNKVQPGLVLQPFDDFLGGAPFATVVPIRIADSVIHFYSSAMAEGIDYARQIGCQAISISMGGVPSRAWARAVNSAYEAGVTIVAAAGNNFGGLPTRSTVYPARFRRVVAACGATADKTPYYAPGSGSMQGNFGPPAKMNTALAAFTPNIPWAEIGCGKIIDLDGAGTSAATPQVAAAAALWLQEYSGTPGLQGWRRVEAVRKALFTSADTSAPDTKRFFGRGLLRAQAALGVSPDLTVPMTPPDRVSFPWIRMLFNLEAVPPPQGKMDMYEIEAMQLFLRSARLQEIAADADPESDPLNTVDTRRLCTELAREPAASKSLRSLLDRTLPRT